MKQETIFGYPLEQLNKEAAAIFATHSIGERIKDLAIKEKFKLVYDRHPYKEKVEGDYELIVVKKRKFNRKCFAIKTSCEKILTFSLRHALKKKQNETTWKHYQELCRDIVRLDIINKKKELIKLNGNLCEETGKFFQQSQLDLHHKIPFEKICIKFLIENSLDLNNSIFQKDNQDEITFKDKSLISKFRNFHAKYLKNNSGLLHSKINRGKKSKSKYIKIEKSTIVSIAPVGNKKNSKQLDLFK